MGALAGSEVARFALPAPEPPLPTPSNGSARVRAPPPPHPPAAAGQPAPEASAQPRAGPATGAADAAPPPPPDVAAVPPDPDTAGHAPAAQAPAGGRDRSAPAAAGVVPQGHHVPAADSQAATEPATSNAEAPPGVASGPQHPWNGRDAASANQGADVAHASLDTPDGGLPGAGGGATVRVDADEGGEARSATSSGRKQARAPAEASARLREAAPAGAGAGSRGPPPEGPPHQGGGRAGGQPVQEVLPTAAGSGSSLVSRRAAGAREAEAVAGAAPLAEPAAGLGAGATAGSSGSAGGMGASPEPAAAGSGRPQPEPAASASAACVPAGAEEQSQTDLRLLPAAPMTLPKPLAPPTVQAEPVVATLIAADAGVGGAGQERAQLVPAAPVIVPRALMRPTVLAEPRSAASERGASNALPGDTARSSDVAALAVPSAPFYQGRSMASASSSVGPDHGRRGGAAEAPNSIAPYQATSKEAAPIAGPGSVLQAPSLSASARQAVQKAAERAAGRPEAASLSPVRSDGTLELNRVDFDPLA